ncbi:MAG: signal peptidase I [Dehalococcoidia bacterium]
MLRTLLRIPAVYPLLAFLTARRVVVRGPSMSPALLPGERVLVDRLAYRDEAPRRGDIVLAADPRQPRRRIVKRIAGGPGERVEIDGRTWALGDDEWLLLGDAPEMSTDGRDFGPVGREAILGRAWMVYWPPRAVRRLRP